MQPGDHLEWQALRDSTVLCRHKAADSQRAAVDLAASKLADQ